MTISYLIRPTQAGYEWRSCASLSEASEFIAEDDILAIYEVEERPHQAPLLSDITEKAAKLWLEKHEGEIEIEDEEAIGIPDLVKRYCEEEIAEIVGENVDWQSATERDRRSYMMEKV